MSPRYLLAAQLVLGLFMGSAFPIVAAAEPSASPKKAGDIMVRLRGVLVRPDDNANIHPIGGNTQLSNEYVPELDFTYFLADQLALELILATSRHSVKANGTSLGQVDIGKVSLLPPTLTLQWHPLPDSQVSPYVGAGINYTIFYDQSTRGVIEDIDYDNKIGWALQAGLDYNITGNWFLNADVKKLWLNTRAEMNGGSITADVDINPWLFGVGLGYKF